MVVLQVLQLSLLPASMGKRPLEEGKELRRDWLQLLQRSERTARTKMSEGTEEEQGRNTAEKEQEEVR